MPCTAIKRDGQPCNARTTHESGLCGRHQRVQRDEQVRQTIRILWDRIADSIWVHDIFDLDFLLLPVTAAVNMGWIPEHLGHRIGEAAAEEIVLRNQIHFPVLPTGPDTRPELQRIADDGQNVHTGHVNKQTNESLQRLMETPVPPSQNTLAEIWKFAKKKRVQTDMKKWYGVETCRQEKDWLYKKTLDGLWARIKASSHKDELTKRLVEEATESVGMCCDGHIARLCNVLVGFDDLFVPQISTGEALQQKISAIASLDISVEEKVGEAWTVFEELAIPMEQREAWIDAF